MTPPERAKPRSLSNEELAERIDPESPRVPEYTRVAPVTLTLEDAVEFEQPIYRRKGPFIQTGTLSPLWTESGEEEDVEYVATPPAEFEVKLDATDPAAGPLTGWLRDRKEPNGTVSFGDKSADCSFRVDDVTPSDIPLGESPKMTFILSFTPKTGSAFREVLVAANVEDEAILLLENNQ